jgi:hypothetical protein
MFTAEPSYFNFLMEHRSGRRGRFAQAVGVMPELTGEERSRRAQRERSIVLNGDCDLSGPGATSGR